MSANCRRLVVTGSAGTGLFEVEQRVPARGHGWKGSPPGAEQAPPKGGAPRRRGEMRQAGAAWGRLGGRFPRGGVDRRCVGPNPPHRSVARSPVGAAGPLPGAGARLQGRERPAPVAQRRTVRAEHWCKLLQMCRLCQLWPVRPERGAGMHGGRRPHVGRARRAVWRNCNA